MLEERRALSDTVDIIVYIISALCQAAQIWLSCESLCWLVQVSPAFEVQPVDGCLVVHVNTNYIKGEKDYGDLNTHAPGKDL